MRYDYIIIDEYQDISDGEYLLARNTSNKNDSTVFAVGDDWQSIYSFRGSNINYITKFNNYFDRPTILSINNTYRNSQELVNITGKFIKENKDQIDKSLVSLKHLEHPVHFVIYDDRIDEEMGNSILDETIEYDVLKKLIMKIHQEQPLHNILILGRNNNMIEKCFKYDKDFIDDLGTKIKISFIKDLDIDGMTIHKSKGLTYDEVIIIGMNKTFPRNDLNDYWLIDLFKYKKQEESIEFAEERRILYVALTRTKNNVYILTNKNSKNRSNFVDELISICRE
jgi:DNA helicase-4